MNQLELMARMFAHQTGRAQPISSHLKLKLQKDSRILSFLSMAGEDNTIHMAALSSLHEEPTFFCIPDPRNRDDQFSLFQDLAKHLLPYFDQCWQEASFAQIWVSSQGAIEHLSRVGQMMLSKHAPAEVQALGRLLAYLHKRQPICGQQTLLSATQALKMHYATGQTPTEDEHLGALLSWIDPLSPNATITEAIEEAEDSPMGYKTLPAFDVKILAPLVDRFSKAKKAGRPKAELDAIYGQICRALEPIVLQIHRGIQRAIAYLHEFQVEPSLLDELAKQEAFAYRGAFDKSGEPAFWNSFPGKDSVKQSTLELSARERYESNVNALFLRHEKVAQAGALLSGGLLHGEVKSVKETKVGRKTLITFELHTSQRVLHIRPDDGLVCLHRDRFGVRVKQIQRIADGTTCVILCLTSGMKKWGAPQVGQEFTLTSTEVDWWMYSKERTLFSRRLNLHPFTHEKTAYTSERSGKTSKHNLSAALEALR